MDCGRKLNALVSSLGFVNCDRNPDLAVPSLDLVSGCIDCGRKLKALPLSLGVGAGGGGGAEVSGIDAGSGAVCEKEIAGKVALALGVVEIG